MGLTGFNRARREAEMLLAAQKTASPLPVEEVVAEPVAPAVESETEEKPVKAHAVGKKKGATNDSFNKK